MRLVRHNIDGVWFGDFEVSEDGNWLVAPVARRLRRWYGPSDLSGVAAGATLKEGSYTTPPVEDVRLPIASGMGGNLKCSPNGEANLRALKIRDMPL